MNIRLLQPDDKLITAALQTAREVFGECLAGIYSEEGRRNFEAFLDSEGLREGISRGSIKVYVCCGEDGINGMMAVREDGHISLAFVKSSQQGKGVGRQLFGRISEEMGRGEYTVNAAPPAVGFYRSLGFAETDMELIEGGIRYVPMRLGIR